jgi:hypothetical protein
MATPTPVRYSQETATFSNDVAARDQDTESSDLTDVDLGSLFAAEQVRCGFY